MSKKTFQSNMKIFYFLGFFILVIVIFNSLGYSYSQGYKEGLTTNPPLATAPGLPTPAVTLKPVSITSSPVSTVKVTAKPVNPKITFKPTYRPVARVTAGPTARPVSAGPAARPAAAGPARPAAAIYKRKFFRKK